MAAASNRAQYLKKLALIKLKTLLECPICLDSYTDPRGLPCLHTYCKRCIDNLVPEIGSRDIIKCPECRQVYQLDKEGASSLPEAFYVYKLQEIFQELSKPVPYECSERRDEIRHHDHLYEVNYVDVLFEKHAQEIRSSLESVNTKINQVTKILAQFDYTEKNREKEEVVKKGTDQTIEQHTSRLKGAVRKLKDSLKRAELKKVLVQLKSCKEFVEEELRSRSRHEILSAKKQLMQRINDALSEVKVSEPGQSADTEYVRTLSPPDVGSVTCSLNCCVLNDATADSNNVDGSHLRVTSESQIPDSHRGSKTTGDF